MACSTRSRFRAGPLSLRVGQFHVAANLSMVYGELPVHQRPSAAARDGYTFVESWWPFEALVPLRSELEEFCASLESAGVRLVLLNLAAGRNPSVDRGVLNSTLSDVELEAHLNAVCEIVERTGCSRIHALLGNRTEATTEAKLSSRLLGRIAYVADRVAGLGATVVLETLSAPGNPRYPLHDIGTAAETVRESARRSACGNVALLVDTFHLATMGADPSQAIVAHGPLVGHVQFADAPGRGRPGTGEVDFDAVMDALRHVGYSGYVGFEYDPNVVRLGDVPPTTSSKETP